MAECALQEATRHLFIQTQAAEWIFRPQFVERGDLC